jgi:hypothetical protein
VGVLVAEHCAVAADRGGVRHHRAAKAGDDLPCGRHIIAEHDNGTLGWAGQLAYLRLPDPRYRFTAVWLDAADVTRR